VNDDRTTRADIDDPAFRGGGVDEEAEVEILAIEIEQTRDEMTGTVEAIGERLDPATIMTDAKETVREATVGKVEAMANDVAETANEYVQEVSYTAQQAGSGIIETIKQNPIPAAMAGIGLGWLVMNRSSGESRGGGRRWMGDDGRWHDQAWFTGSGGQSGWQGDRDRGWGRGDWQGTQSGEGGITSQASSMGRQAGEKVDELGRSVGDIADQARDTMSQVPDQLGSTVQDVRWNAQRAMEENPLAAGAVAVAVGAALGMILPATQMERRAVAPVAEKLAETAESAADQATEQLEEMERSASR
jgi:ElaB/YqjD/DUF883 family membrane-anchored ribosome-binding protein